MFNPTLSVRAAISLLSFSPSWWWLMKMYPGSNSLLKVDIDDTDKLVLSHDENIFSVHFAALDYTNPQNIRYAYILDGFEKQWTLPTNSVIDTESSEEIICSVSVLPIVMVCGWITNVSWILSFCLSFWNADVCYFCFILIIILVWFISCSPFIRLKHEVSVEQQISDIKLRFFTNISMNFVLLWHWLGPWTSLEEW